LNGIHIILIANPDQEPNQFAEEIEFEFRLPWFRCTCARVASLVTIPDGVHIAIPSLPNPMDSFSPVITPNDIKASTAFMNFTPSKASLDAAEFLRALLSSNGTAVDNWDRWGDAAYKVLSRMGIFSTNCPTNTVAILIGHKPQAFMLKLMGLREKAWNIEKDSNASWADVSNAWHEVFVAEEAHREHRIKLGLSPTNAPHSYFSPTGWNFDGSPVDPKQGSFHHK
jgi:hypothetical protein